VTSNLACIGLAVADEAALFELLDRIRPEFSLLGTSGGLQVFRWQDPSGARLVLGLRGDNVVEFVPSFAGRPGVNLRNLRMLNDAVLGADVVDDDGEQTTAIAFEVEQRRAAVGTWSGRAAVTAFAPEAEFFADEETFAASPRSLMDPDADPDTEPPAAVTERGFPWPLRMAPESFISYGQFAAAADAGAEARLNGVVTAVEPRTNVLTGDRFLACRVQSIGSEFDLVTVLPEGAQPKRGSVVAANVFLIASIEELAFAKPRRRLFGRR
jgi:hypothetical protein